MDSTQYPKFLSWVAVLNGRDNALLLIGMIALVALIWLFMARTTAPRLLPALRIAGVAGFYSTLFFFVGGKVIGLW